MADPKNVIIDIKNGLTDVRQQMNLLKQDTSGWVSTLSSGVSRMSGGSGGYSSNSSTLVAPMPKFAPPAPPVGVVANINNGGGGGNNGGGGGGGNGGGGYTGNTNLSKYIGDNPAAGFLYAASLTSGMLDQPGESVEAQLLMSRTAYFNNQTYGQVNATQANLAKQGTVKDKFDVMRGLAAAQSSGITGPNVTQASGGMGSVAAGVSAVSNLVPGAGFEGTMRAFGSMQQGRNVNMLRGIGIQLRDEQGNLKPPDQIIDDIWKKICRDYGQAYGSGKKPSKREVLIGLQPGNSMDSMLDMYFGNDPVAKQLVANGLIYKAETGGSAISKETLTSLGATTEATNAFSNRNAASARQTGLTASSGAEGYTNAANAITKFSTAITENMLPELSRITKINAEIITALGAIDGTPTKLLGGIAALSGKGYSGIAALGGLGVGVFAANKIVSGSDQKSGGATPDQFAIDILNGLNAPVTENNKNTLKIMMNKEGGHFKNSASYNPLNTTLNSAEYESVNYKTKMKGRGVQAYPTYAQGVNATVNTFLGSNFQELTTLLQADSPQAKFFDALKRSKWSEDRYKNTDFSKINPNYNPQQTSNNTNNNSITININGAQDPIAVSKEVQRVIPHFLDQSSIKNKAVNK